MTTSDDMPTITCVRCNATFEGFAPTQAFGCACDIEQEGIAGFYGSTVLDGYFAKLTPGKSLGPAKGTICDHCVKELLDDGTITVEDNQTPNYFEPPTGQSTADTSVSSLDDITEEDIGKALMGMLRAYDAEYETMTKDELTARWRFSFDPGKSLVANMYLFYDQLALFAGSCRRWEEAHNGHGMVVERVRDTYVLPKIHEFTQTLKDHGCLTDDSGTPS